MRLICQPHRVSSRSRLSDDSAAALCPHAGWLGPARRWPRPGQILPGKRVKYALVMSLISFQCRLNMTLPLEGKGSAVPGRLLGSRAHGKSSGPCAIESSSEPTRESLLERAYVHPG